MGTVYIIKNKLDAAHPEVPKENLKKAEESLSKGIEEGECGVDCDIIHSDI